MDTSKTPPVTVPELFARVAAERPNQPAVRHKKNGSWHTINWGDYHAQARRTARGFMRLGLEPGQGVSIIGYNCPQWFLSDVGAILAGGFPAGIYTTNSPEQCEYIADHSDSAIVVVEDRAQLQKFLSVRERLPKLKAIVQMFGRSEEEGVFSWDEMLALADEVSEEELDARIAAQKADDVCTLIYTSGTTGNPKAVMITHDNATWTAALVVDTLANVWEERHGNRDIDVQTISYLPLSHIAEQVVSIYGPMTAGGCTSFAEGLEQLGDNLREVRPTVFLGVPRVWEKIQGKIVAAAAGNSGLKKKIGAWARGKGLAGGYAEQRGEPMPFGYGLADKLVFSKVRAQLGLDRCFFQFTSAAPISMDTLEFFLSLGLPVYEIYGMSECTGPATVSTPNRYRSGKAGFCPEGAELKIAEDGEICMRGRQVCKGYYKNDEATAETIDSEGWLHSGDLGSVDDKGFLQITGRKKDLIITSGGENIAPQVIEGMLVGIPGLSQAVVIGDARKYLTALLTLDPEKLPSLAQQLGSPAITPEAAASCPKFRAHVDQAVKEVNAHLARVQTIKRFTLLAGEFSIEADELTPTMKIKRRIVNANYADQIEAMYGDA